MVGKMGKRKKGWERIQWRLGEVRNEDEVIGWERESYEALEVRQ